MAVKLVTIPLLEKRGGEDEEREQSKIPHEKRGHFITFFYYFFLRFDQNNPYIVIQRRSTGG